MNSFFFFFKRINCKLDFNSFFNKIVYLFLVNNDNNNNNNNNNNQSYVFSFREHELLC